MYSNNKLREWQKVLSKLSYFGNKFPRSFLTVKLVKHNENNSDIA